MPHETSMSAASRKAWNLKVIQRHDPDILCLWDQVSYVMLMQYSPTGWTKTSVEGSLFLFDRRGSPRYGFFILNRSSSQNYMHLLTPEDNLEVLESYVIFRAKGSKDAPVMGLWASDPDHRHYLGETLLSLHAHIKSGSTEPFYNPADAYGTTQSQLAVTSPSTTATSTTNYAPSVTGTSSTPSRNQSVSEAGGMQSLNDLFARLSSSASMNSVASAPSTSQPPLFSTQSAQAPAASSSNSLPPTQPPQSAPTPTGPLRGQALLDSLFAMASPTRTPVAAQPPSTNLPMSGSFNMPQSQSSSTFTNFGGPPTTAPTNPPQGTTQSPTSNKGGDLLAQLFANLNTGSQKSSINQPAPQTQSVNHTRAPSTPPPVMSSLPADPAIIHSAKVTPEPRSDRKRNNTRRGYATDTSPRPHYNHRMSVFDEDATHSRSNSQVGEDVLASLNGSVRNKPRVGRALVPFQSDTGPVYHPDPTRPHVSNRFPAGENGEEQKIYAIGIDEEAEDQIFYDGRGNANGEKGPSPKRQRRRKNGRGGANGSGGRNGDVVNLDRQIAGEVLMQGIEWDDGVVDKQLFLQSIYALLNEQEFVDQLYNDYKIAQTRQNN